MSEENDKEAKRALTFLAVLQVWWWEIEVMSKNIKGWQEHINIVL